MIAVLVTLVWLVPTRTAERNIGLSEKQVPDAAPIGECRSRGVAMVVPVGVGKGGIDLLIRNELLKQHQTRDRKAVGKTCFVALEQWAMGGAMPESW